MANKSLTTRQKMVFRGQSGAPVAPRSPPLKPAKRKGPIPAATVKKPPGG